MAKRRPRRGLLARHGELSHSGCCCLFFSVQPFAYVVANYTRYDREKKCGEDFFHMAITSFLLEVRQHCYFSMIFYIILPLFYCLRRGTLEKLNIKPYSYISSGQPYPRTNTGRSSPPRPHSSRTAPPNSSGRSGALSWRCTRPGRGRPGGGRNRSLPPAESVSTGPFPPFSAP